MIKTTRLPAPASRRFNEDRSSARPPVSPRPSRVGRKHKVAAAVAALAVTAGAFGVTSPALTSSPSTLSYSTTSSLHQRTSAGQAIPVEFGRFWAGDAVTSGVLSTDVQKRPSIKPIINWLKKHGKKHYDKLKVAAKKGHAAVKEWFYKLPKPIRVTITFLWSGTLWALFDALVKYFTS